MIKWTIHGTPVNISEVTAVLMVRDAKRYEAVCADVSSVILKSFEEKIHPTDPQWRPDPNFCAECGCQLDDTVYIHTWAGASYCESCVESLPKQCECCDLEYDLGYIFDSHGINLILTR